GFAAGGRGGRTVDRVGRVGGAFRVHNDAVESEGQRQFPRFFDHFFPAGIDVPIAVRPQRLVAVAAMDVQHVIRAFDDFSGDLIGDALGDRTISLARIDAVEVFAVHRRVVDRAL